MRKHGGSMVLVRKLRRASGSVSVVIPADFAKAMGLDVGGFVEIVPLDRDTLGLRRAREA